MASKYQKMRKQGTAGKKQHVIFIHQKLEIMRRREIGTIVIVKYVRYTQNISYGPLWPSTESVKGFSKWQKLKQTTLAQLDKELYKWFTAMRSEGNKWLGLW
jgi:hypothetical protein